GSCTTDNDCGAIIGGCMLDANCYFGPPTPVPSGAASTCILNGVATDACGAADLENNSSSLSVGLSSRAYLTSNNDSPCPQCLNNQCVGGARDGFGCTPGSPDTNTSVDCPPSLNSFIGSLPVTLAPLTTGATSLGVPQGFLCLGQTFKGAFGVAAAS